MNPQADHQHVSVVPLDTDKVIERPSELTAGWLTAAIRAGTIADFTVERIGTGQMSECYGVRLTYTDAGPGLNGPESVVFKVAATDEVSRQTGVALGLYDREVCFYRDIAPRLRGPDPLISLADVRDGVRRQSFVGVMMAIASPMLVERTERGDMMFMTMLQRHCEHVLDTDALATLAAPTPILPLRRSRDDESAHTATDEPLWSESWYGDFVDAAMGFAGWVRLGLVPNQHIGWFHALFCGPDLPTVAVVDFEVPLPVDPWALRTDAIDFTHSASDALGTYRVVLRGRAQSYADPAALLRGECGAPVEVAVDLVWTTDGTPYRCRLTTRYEIPCAVSGTVTIDGTSYTVDSAPGQRDHSWGMRDRWSMDWAWSARHLEDGTHLHAVDLRIPGARLSVSATYRTAGVRSLSCKLSLSGKRSAQMDYPSVRHWRSIPAV
jgi:hypothetical protein